MCGSQMCFQDFTFAPRIQIFTAHLMMACVAGLLKSLTTLGSSMSSISFPFKLTIWIVYSFSLQREDHLPPASTTAAIIQQGTYKYWRVHRFLAYCKDILMRVSFSLQHRLLKGAKLQRSFPKSYLALRYANIRGCLALPSETIFVYLVLSEDDVDIGGLLQVERIKTLPGKKGQTRLLSTVLPQVMAFVQSALVKGRSVCVSCDTGKDVSVGVIVTALQMFFDDNGHFAMTAGPQKGKTDCHSYMSAVLRHYYQLTSSLFAQDSNVSFPNDIKRIHPQVI